MIPYLGTDLGFAGLLQYGLWKIEVLVRLAAYRTQLHTLLIRSQYGYRHRFHPSAQPTVQPTVVTIHLIHFLCA